MTPNFNLTHYNELGDFDNRFCAILRKHFTAFALWSILNCVVSFIAIFIIRGNPYYYFWMMDGIWGVINFAVAIWFFYHTLYKKLPKGSSYERLAVQNHVERMLFLNIGIDMAYVFVGFWLREHSFICNVPCPNLWLGFGWAIVVQGLFLLVQDITFLHLHRFNFRKAQPFFEKMLVKK